MLNRLPGADVLGRSFNVWGIYEAQETTPLFEMDYDGGHIWNYDDNEYLVPANTSFDPSPSADILSYGFESRTTFQQHFAGKAGLSSSDITGFFSAEFDLEYGSSISRDSDYKYGLTEINRQFWTLRLNDAGPGQLAGYVTSDPDYQNIPTYFDERDPANRAAFFRFFQKFGTHFVASVSAGARLYYSYYVSTQWQYSAESIKANLVLEVNALFASSRTEASANWDAVSNEWLGSRQVNVHALGGDIGSVQSLAPPSFFDWLGEIVNTWTSTARQDPAVIDLTVASVDRLFSGEQSDAVRQALDAYARKRLHVEARTGNCFIYFDGDFVLPEGGGEHTTGAQIAVIERSTLALRFAKSYLVEFWSPDGAYDEAMLDLSPYLNDDSYAFVFTGWTMLGHTFPPKPFADFLTSIGAGVGLDIWQNLRNLEKDENPQWESADCAHSNYCLVGIPGIGKGNGAEAFHRAGSTDTGEPFINLQDYEEYPATPALIDLDAYRLQDGGLTKLKALKLPGVAARTKTISAPGRTVPPSRVPVSTK